MSIIVPDDLWKDIRRHCARASKEISMFIETHPEQCQCIVPTGEAIIKLTALVRALTKANREETPPEKEQG